MIFTQISRPKKETQEFHSTIYSALEGAEYRVHSALESAEYRAYSALEGSEYRVHSTLEGAEYRVDSALEGAEYRVHSGLESEEYRVQRIWKRVLNSTECRIKNTEYRIDIKRVKNCNNRTIFSSSYCLSRYISLLYNIYY